MRLLHIICLKKTEIANKAYRKAAPNTDGAYTEGLTNNY
jgi:hypothetical protein